MDFARRLAERMEEKGFNAYSAAKEAGLSEDAVRDILRGKVKDPGASKLVKLAKLLQTTVEELLGAEAALPGEVPEERELPLPIRYATAAGEWLEEDNSRQTEPKMFKAVRIPEYEGLPQWLERVQGDSINMRIPDGALVHVIEAIAMGYEPKTGDLVVVVRTRLGGLLRERTVKEVEVTRRGKVLLWPRSHSDRWKEPVEMVPPAANREDVTVEIVGKVARAYIGFE